ncbi:MAG TPA: cytochrome d ubiquinol oxidase subunit II [Stellaceae bacterium]|nr:cytochrome d ubiquinol oxidase subunit II [Stellaceae bacterium]
MMPLDYDILRFLWWALLGILLIGFAVLDGYDLGTAMLLPFVGETDAERRQVRETVEANWEGHQVWLILGGGAAFAAWPPLYAASFSGFYIAMLLVLVTLILRPVGFTFRDKIAEPRWRNSWDWALAISGFVPSLVFGVAFGNLLQGVPFSFDADLRLDYTGGFFGLLNPFALLSGLVSVAMLATQGGTWLALKTDGAVAERATRIASVAGLVAAGLFVLGGMWIAFGIDGYAISGTISHTGPSNPLGKTVVRAQGAWLDVYTIHRLLALAPLLGFAMPLAASLLVARRAHLSAFIASSLGIAGIIATAGISMFPFLLPSSTHPEVSLTVWDSSSSQLTLFIMLIAVLLFLPIVLFYTGWALRVMRGPVRLADVEHSEDRY